MPKKRGRPRKIKRKEIGVKNQKTEEVNSMNSLSSIDISESYVSLIIGAIVVIFAATLIIVFLRQRNLLNISNQPRQEVSSTNTKETAKTEDKVTKYIIVEGDDLKAISLQFYGTTEYYLDIAKVNNIENPDLLEIGKELKITRVATKAQINGEKITGDSYTVKEDEYLWDIAVKAYGDGFKWVDIAKANNLEFPNVLPAGTILKIPR